MGDDLTMDLHERRLFLPISLKKPSIFSQSSSVAICSSGSISNAANIKMPLNSTKAPTPKASDNDCNAVSKLPFVAKKKKYVDWKRSSGWLESWEGSFSQKRKLLLEPPSEHYYLSRYPLELRFQTCSSYFKIVWKDIILLVSSRVL